MYDLALSEHGDLIVAGNSDLAGISGIDLIEQRIRLRLRLRRGSWIYDRNKTMGSNLHTLIGMSPHEIHTTIGPLVREALRPMSEITVEDVLHGHDPEDSAMDMEGHSLVNRGVTVTVFYSLNQENEEGSESQSQQTRSISVSIPIGGGGV